MAVDPHPSSHARLAETTMPLVVSGKAASRLARVHGSLGSADGAVSGSGSHTPHAISLPVAVLSHSLCDVTTSTSCPVEGCTASGSRVVHAQILSDRDLDTEIGLDIDILRQLGTFDASLVQVSGAVP